MGDTSRGILDERACFSLHCRVPPSLFFSLFFVLSSFALLPWGVTISWPFKCTREENSSDFKREKRGGWKSGILAFFPSQILYHFTAFCQSVRLTVSFFWCSLCCFWKGILCHSVPTKKLQIRQHVFQAWLPASTYKKSLFLLFVLAGLEPLNQHLISYKLKLKLQCCHRQSLAQSFNWYDTETMKIKRLLNYWMP